MLYITQLIYVKKSQEHLFHQFEDLAIPILWKYNGQLLLRIRPTSSNLVHHTMEPPYEIHLVSFNTEEDFEAYREDEERKRYLHLKDQSISSILLIKGVQL
jgi:hypothetical protein